MAHCTQAWHLLTAATQHSRAQRTAAQHMCIAQHSTAQHSTAQHSTAQHSTARGCIALPGTDHPPRLLHYSKPCCKLCQAMQVTNLKRNSQPSTLPVELGLRNASLSRMMCGWDRRRRMHTSRSTRLAFSALFNTSGMRFSATWGTGAEVCVCVGGGVRGACDRGAQGQRVSGRVQHLLHVLCVVQHIWDTLQRNLGDRSRSVCARGGGGGGGVTGGHWGEEGQWKGGWVGRYVHPAAYCEVEIEGV
jgi:hypothetical protein